MMNKNLIITKILRKKTVMSFLKLKILRIFSTESTMPLEPMYNNDCAPVGSNIVKTHVGFLRRFLNLDVRLFADGHGFTFIKENRPIVLSMSKLFWEPI